MSIEEQVAAFEKLLDEEREEQAYQEFLERHTRFIPREFVQNHGVAGSLVLRKLGFAADYKSDFFYLSKSSDDWNAVHIEIERSSKKFFSSNSDNPSPEFYAAITQINRWKSWLSDPTNHLTFLNTIRSIQVPSHMQRNPTFHKFVLVYGRRSEYANNPGRARMIRSYEDADFKIMSFDSLMEAIGSKPELSIASRKNQFIDIETDVITNENLYAWIEPSEFRVSKTLHAKLAQGSPSQGNSLISKLNVKDRLIEASKTIKVR